MLKKARKLENIWKKKETSRMKGEVHAVYSWYSWGWGVKWVSHLAHLLYLPQLLAYLVCFAMTIQFKSVWFRKRSSIYWAPTVCQALQAICVNVLS